MLTGLSFPGSPKRFLILGKKIPERDDFGKLRIIHCNKILWSCKVATLHKSTDAVAVSSKRMTDRPAFAYWCDLRQLTPINVGERWSLDTAVLWRNDPISQGRKPGGKFGRGDDDRLLSRPNFLLAKPPCWNIWHKNKNVYWYMITRQLKIKHMRHIWGTWRITVPPFDILGDVPPCPRGIYTPAISPSVLCAHTKARGYAYAKIEYVSVRAYLWKK